MRSSEVTCASRRSRSEVKFWTYRPRGDRSLPTRDSPCTKAPDPLMPTAAARSKGSRLIAQGPISWGPVHDTHRSSPAGLGTAATHAPGPTHKHRHRHAAAQPQRPP